MPPPSARRRRGSTSSWTAARLSSSIERPPADHRLRALGDDVRARARLVVAALDEEPVPVGALQGEAPAQLGAVQDEDRVAALERLGPRHPAALLVGAAVP